MVFRTAGESHGKGILGFFDKFPSNLKLDREFIDKKLALRQSGYGRGARQKIESDKIEILSGVRNSVTMGSPLSFIIKNRDYENWRLVMGEWEAEESERRVTKVRPGHADLAGMKKFFKDDARNILERASARETAARAAAGAICQIFLRELSVETVSFVRSIGDVKDEGAYSFSDICSLKEEELFMCDKEAAKRAKALIDRVKAEGDTLGGVVEIRVKGLKSGFGSPFNYTDKLDAKLAFAAMSVQAIKGVEIGEGFACAFKKGSEVHDEIFSSDGKFFRKTNRAGGIEGGMSNGEEIVLRAAMKPIPTLMRGLNTVDIDTMQPATADTERSDVTAVPACAVVVESAVSLALFESVWERLGGDSMEEILKRWKDCF